MIRLLILFVAMAVASVCSYRCVKGSSPDAGKGILLDSMPELGWLKGELGLSAEQYEKVRQQHLAYRPRCRELCHRVEEKRQAVRAIEQKGEIHGEAFKEAMLDYALVSAECRKEMIEHLYRTADLMEPAQAEKFLRLTLPFTMEAGPSDELFKWRR